MDELSFATAPGGVTFRLFDRQGVAVSPTDWATRQCGRSQPAVLLRLIDDELATEFPESVFVPSDTLAGLTRAEAEALGLPPPVPHHLRIRATDILTDPRTRLVVELLGENDRPARSARRDGCLVNIEGDDYLALDPLYSLLEGIDRFNQGSQAHPPLARWGRLKQLLPEDAEVEGYLQAMTIAFASAFTVTPFLNSSGEPDFEVVPGRLRSPELPNEESSFEEVLPEARQSSFSRYFRRMGHARGQLPLGAGWVVVFSEEVTRALEVARDHQAGSKEERQAFIERPQLALKQGVPDLPEEDLEKLFYDVGYGDRVLGIGRRIERVLPWVKRETQDWLPPESLGLKIGDEYVDLDPKEIPGLRGRVERAIAEGETNIGHGAAVLPASEDTLRALEALIGECRPTGPAGTDSARASSEPSRGASEAPLVLQVHPNFEAVDYRARSRPRGGQGLEAVSDLVRNNPYPHQRTALEWLLAHWTEGSPGALLADDMGLGKTFQTLAFLAWVRSLMVRGLYPRRPFVVVAPTGLLTNWQEEEREHIQRPGLGRMVEAFGPWLRVLKTKGDSLDGGGPDLPVLHEARLRDAGWVLTSYETWRDYQLSFGRIRWAIAVFDEVQKVKNPKAGVTEAAKAVNADFTLALTGTPVENRLADLWCVVDLVQPGRLGSLKEFSHTYETPALTEASGEVASLKAEILEKPPPLMLRRMKEDHLEGLPEIFHHAEKRPMPTMQAEAYAQAVRSYQEEAGNPGQMLKLLGRLRSISLHPTEQGGTSDPSYIRSSARLRVLFEVLEEVHGRGEKALVFVESREMQAALIGILQRHFGLSERPLVINGAVSGHKRQERVHRFQRRRGFDVMLLSPKAGGVGLTLTAANHVIHLSRWWNPAVEDQCTDRVFRIGQSKPVHVYYPLAVHPEFEQHSFDLTLDELMRWKRAMGRAVLAPDALSPDEIRDLFEATIRQGAPRRSPADLPAVDTMEPLAFERWVMGILQGLGYTVDRTPSTHDHGADAVARGHEVGPDLLVQCKHTQSQRSIGPEAVREVLAAMGAYGGAASFQGVVFTNGEGFTGSARDLAKANQVALVGRATLNRGVTLNDVFPPTP